MTEKPMALEFPIELEFRNVDFCGGRKTREPKEKPSEQGREPTTNCGLWPYSRPRAQFFPIRTSRPANNIYISYQNSGGG